VRTILGRTGPGAVVFDSPGVSRHHARLTIAGDQAVLEDLGSKNATWVGQTAVTEPTALKDGDELRLGPVVVVVRFGARRLSTQTVDQSERY
jgi:pSer/pThr/pTyr-binding forkhead associated (FHA) protein